MPKSIGSSLKIIFDHFFTISVFWLLLLRVSSKFLYLFIFFYFTRSMKIITGRHHWFLTAESPRLTTMDDNNTLAVFAGYYTISLFPLPAFLNDVHVAGIYPGLIKLSEIKTLSDMQRTRFAMLQYFCLFTRAFLPSQEYFQQ